MDTNETEETLEVTTEENAEPETSAEQGDAPATEVEAETEEPAEDLDTVKEQLRVEREKAERYKAERDRLKEKKPEKPAEGAPSGDYENLFLVASGIKDKEEREEIIKASKRMGVPVEEAVEDEYVLAKIERMRKARSAAGAAARPSGGAMVVKRTVDYYIKKGELPTDKKMLEEVQNEMARRSRETV